MPKYATGGIVRKPILALLGRDGCDLVVPLVAIKSAAPPGSVELTAPIVFKDEGRRIVYGPVLIPDEPDSDGDVVTAEKIEEVAHKFLKEYGTIDVQHTLNFVGRPVESYVAPQDLQFETPEGTIEVPKGSWMLGVYVEDPATWGRVQRGELTGYSIMAVSRSQARKDAQPKRVTLRDLGDGWVAVAVSLVDRPAVPAAKWVAIKSQGKAADTPKPGRIHNLFTAMFERFLRQAEDLTPSASTKGDVDVTKEELQQAVKTAVDEALKPLEQRIGTVETSLKKQPVTEPAGTDPTQKGPEAEPGDPAVKQLLQGIDDRLKAVEKELTPGSRQPAGQDPTTTGPAAATKSLTPTRDAYGRRIKQ